jgi:hypothetical protein
VLNDDPRVSVFSPANAWTGWSAADRYHAMHWDGQHWHPLTIPDDVLADTGNVVTDGQCGYWFGGAAILTGGTWASEPPIEVTGGFGSVVRIPGTESLLHPAGVRNLNSTIQQPTPYRFDL